MISSNPVACQPACVCLLVTSKSMSALMSVVIRASSLSSLMHWLSCLQSTLGLKEAALTGRLYRLDGPACSPSALLLQTKLHYRMLQLQKEHSCHGRDCRHHPQPLSANAWTAHVKPRDGCCMVPTTGLERRAPFSQHPLLKHIEADDREEALADFAA